MNVRALLPKIFSAVFAVSAVICSVPSQSCGDGSFPSAEIKRAANSYGFVYGQMYSMDLLKKQFPEHALLIERRGMKFMNTALGEGWKHLDSFFKNLNPEKYEKLNRELEQKIRPSLPEKYTPEDLNAALAEVDARCAGIGMPEENIVTLLRWNERYDDAPAEEMEENWKRTHSTKTYPKAQHLDLDLTFPRSWECREGHRPHIVLYMQRPYRDFTLGCSIFIDRNPALENISAEDVAALSRSEKDIKSFFGVAALRYSHLYRIEGLPFLCAVFDMENERMDYKGVMRATVFAAFYKDYALQVMFMARADDLDKAQRAAFPLYKAIMNTLVIHNLYRQ